MGTMKLHLRILLAFSLSFLILLWSFVRHINTSPAFGSAVSQPQIRIAFYTVGLGSGYFQLALDLFRSAYANFCTNSLTHVDYYVFSNQPSPRNVPSNFHVIPTVKQGWPFDSQDRFKWIHKHASENPNYDYILWMDADQRFERPICYDLLGELVAVAHPHYFDGDIDDYPYETRPESKAFVPENSRVQNYFSAHVFGGTRNKVVTAMNVMNDWMEEDLSRGIEARVEDESYLNAYLYFNIPTVVLSRIFVWPEGYEDEFPTMLARHGGKSEAAAIARYIEHKPRDDP
jgi:hypothetical protein